MPPGYDNAAELEQMESYWAKENLRGPTWADHNDEEKLRPDDDVSAALFKLDEVVEFVVQYLGTVSGAQRSPNGVIDAMDIAKKNGNVSWRSTTEDAVLMMVSQYGIKVSDTRKQEVFTRVAMHKVGFVLHYVEDSNQHVVVVESGEPGSHDFKYFVYAADSENQAKDMCETLRQAFETVLTKSTFESLN
jgi:hypothetical protein